MEPERLDLYKEKCMRFPTPHFSLDLLYDLTSPLNIVQLQDLFG